MADDPGVDGNADRSPPSGSSPPAADASRRSGPGGPAPSVTGVRETYERIGEHFAKTRPHPWPAVEDFLAGPGPTDATGRLGLDVGCGNGRHLPPLAERVETAVGVDLSRTLLETARDRLDSDDPGGDAARIHLTQGEARHLPLPDGAVDLALSIATIHHLPDSEARIAACDEIARVLAADGRGLIGVWSVTHDRFDADDAGDRWIDWTLPTGETVPRYYHVYDRPTFAAELDASTLPVDRTFEEAGNLYAVVGGG